MTSVASGMTSVGSVAPGVSAFQQVPRQKQKMFFIESSPSESDGFGESFQSDELGHVTNVSNDKLGHVSQGDKLGSVGQTGHSGQTGHVGSQSGHVTSGSGHVTSGVQTGHVKPDVGHSKPGKHVSLQSPPKLDSTKYDDYYNDDDDDSDWDSVESDGSSGNEEEETETTFSRVSRDQNLSSHQLVRPSLLSSMFLNNPDRLQEQIAQQKDKSRIFSKGMIPDESNSVSSKLGSMFSGQAKRVNTFTNLSEANEANYIVENGGLNSDGEDIARDNESVAKSLSAAKGPSEKSGASAKSSGLGAKSSGLGGKTAKSAEKGLKTRPDVLPSRNSLADISRFSGAPTPATVLSATPVAVATHEPVYGSILPSDVVRHSMLASEMSQSVQKSLLNQSELERQNLEALKRRHTSIDLKKMGEAPEWKKEAEEPADFDYHARGW